MDSQRFDAVTRALASGTSRRTLLKLLGGGAAAGALGGIALAPSRIGAQGTIGPGGPCTADADCVEGSCDTTQGICYCEDPAEPWRGCSCNTGTEVPCGETNLLCCAETEGIGVPGICTSPSVGCEPRGQCSTPGENCEETGCCELGECSASGFCLSCYSGTQDPCGNLATEFGGDWVCCTESGAAPGAVGTCTEADLCTTNLPDTGVGTLATEGNRWVMPLALLGAGAAALGLKRHQQEQQR